MLSSIPTGRLSNNSCLAAAITSRLSSGSEAKYSAGVAAVDETMLYFAHQALSFQKVWSK